MMGINIYLVYSYFNTKPVAMINKTLEEFNNNEMRRVGMFWVASPSEEFFPRLQGIKLYKYYNSDEEDVEGDDLEKNIDTSNSL